MLPCMLTRHGLLVCACGAGDHIHSWQEQWAAAAAAEHAEVGSGWQQLDDASGLQAEHVAAAAAAGAGAHGKGEGMHVRMCCSNQ
jgi:hypothetical protein